MMSKYKQKLRKKQEFSLRILQARGHSEKPISHVALCDFAVNYFNLTKKFEVVELYQYLYERGIKVYNVLMPLGGLRVELFLAVEKRLIENMN